MRIARHALGAATIALASFLALSCNNAYGIFDDVQAQKAQNGTKVFQETTTTNAFKLGGYYYASTARLYRRSAATNDSPWAQVNVGGSGSYTLRGVVLVGSTIFALTGNDTSEVALYSSSDGDAWSPISALPKAPVVLPTATNYTYAFDALFTANNELFAVDHLFVPNTSTSADGTSNYDLYRYNGVAFVPVANFTNLGSTVRGVVYDGSSYWFASEGQLYSGSLADGSNAASRIDSFTDLSTRTIWGISYTGGHLYVATKNGYLYQDSGTAVEVNSSSVPLTTVIQVPSSVGDIILVGTDTADVNTPAVGYYEGTFGTDTLKVGSSNAYVAATSSIYNTTVSVFPVHAFYYDGNASSGNLFVCISPGASSTSNYGLYESQWNTADHPNAWSGWSAQ
jgi:hypothetical protein